MTQGYIPSTAERQETLRKGDFLKLSGDGVFATLQGEGVTAGFPAVFLRLQNCNLSCGAAGQGWQCDAWYTWDRSTPEYWQETKNVPIEEAAVAIKGAWQTAFGERSDRRIVVTGGEPLLQQRKILDLLSFLPNWAIEIETNGTILPDKQLASAQINCSPKLASSGNKLSARYRPKILRSIAAMPNAWFKFVIVDDADVEEVNKIVNENSIDYSRVLLMSEGTDAAKLQENDAKLAEIADSLGARLTSRNQIFWFGNTRAT